MTNGSLSSRNVWFFVLLFFWEFFLFYFSFFSIYIFLTCVLAYSYILFLGSSPHTTNRQLSPHTGNHFPPCSVFFFFCIWSFHLQQVGKVMMCGSAPSGEGHFSSSAPIFTCKSVNDISITFPPTPWDPLNLSIAVLIMYKPPPTHVLKSLSWPL